MKKIKFLLFQVIFVSLVLNLVKGNNTESQVFTKIVTGPIPNEPISEPLIGCAWVDIDNDERLDLFICGRAVFKNLGNGNFIRLDSALLEQELGQGNSWADYNNDGFIDVFVSSTLESGSFLYKNNGNSTFTKVTSGVMSEFWYNTGFGCAWGDINNDSYPDLIIAALKGYGLVNHPNRLYLNNGNGDFFRIDTTDITDSLDTFVIPVWSDYDQDGDIDLFFGTGPADGSLNRNYLFRNYLKEQNIHFYFQRIDTGIIGMDICDGQLWNWIDYDNDGDFDAYLTNFLPSVKNRLYRCDGIRFYRKMTSDDAGHIVSNPGLYNGSSWGDYDNDGDLDCILTAGDGSGPLYEKLRYHRNNGNGTFTFVNSIFSYNGPNWGSCSGDYDNDGDLDIFVTGTDSSKALYRNDIQNNNKWVNIRCIGAGPGFNLSNKSALGTIVKLKANINGTPVWQMREINSQNGFNSMNMLNVHFGLGNAVIIDSLTINWQAGLRQIFTKVPLNKFYKITEGQGLTEVIIGVNHISSVTPENFSLHQNYPNPFNPSTTIRFDVSQAVKVSLRIYDVMGKEIETIVNEFMKPGQYEAEWNASLYASGVYFYKIEAGEFYKTKKMVLVK